MEDNYEHLIFIKELGRLMIDYGKCKDADLKQEIYKDIKLLGKVINL
ncbi:MAG: hypothetical protein Q8906_09565 [Bacillota bacterium]|nr:hypothetical protein [Bacillota bacterium]MDP4170843.1 hypothetical protein [Bacillota bacterium]